MSDPKIKIINAHSFKEAYDIAPDEIKEQIEIAATDYYMNKFEAVIYDFDPDDTVFIVNVLRCLLAALECASPEEYQLAYQMMPEDMLQIMKFASMQDDKNKKADGGGKYEAE